MALGLIIGLLSGLANGLLSTIGKIDSLIVTLGTMGIFRSLVTFLTGGGTLTLDSQVRETYRPVFCDSWLNIPIPVWVLALVVLVGSIVLTKTRFGRYYLFAEHGWRCRRANSAPLRIETPDERYVHSGVALSDTGECGAVLLPEFFVLRQRNAGRILSSIFGREPRLLEHRNSHSPKTAD